MFCLSILPRKNYYLTQIIIIILFLPKTPPVVETPDFGPSAGPLLNLVTIGFVRPDVCPTRDTIFLPGKPRAHKIWKVRLQRSRIFCGKPKSQCPAVDVRTTAGQKLNPPSLFSLRSPLSLTFCFGKFELRQRQPGKPKDQARSGSRRGQWIG